MSDALARCKEHGESWSRDCPGCDYAQVRRHDHAERPGTLKTRLAALTADRDAIAARMATAEKERDFARQYRCPDCHWHDGGSVSPCVRHNGCEHGMPGEYDDTWEHWRKRALAAENERDALAAERAMFCALVESLTSERDEARRQLGEVTRERDAAKKGQWLGPWEEARRIGDTGARRRGDGAVACWTHAYLGGWLYSIALAGWLAVESDEVFTSEGAARRACDAHLQSRLLATGWYLAEATKPETPGDDGR